MVVLVAYATDHGSTRGVTDRIAGRLQLRGVGAEACAVADVQEISRYEAVVLGSAIHGGKWLPEARQFAGAIARSHWPATGRAFFRATGGRYGDHRNWPAIEAWADLIAAQLHVKSGA
jgi:menaquinone-dependent protoporphyrinogen oxidase